VCANIVAAAFAKCPRRLIVDGPVTMYKYGKSIVILTSVYDISAEAIHDWKYILYFLLGQVSPDRDASLQRDIDWTHSVAPIRALRISLR
jgi:hypothetical protein